MLLMDPDLLKLTILGFSLLSLALHVRAALQQNEVANQTEIARRVTIADFPCESRRCSTTGARGGRSSGRPDGQVRA